MATLDIAENAAILSKATDLSKPGVKAKDALHVACAIIMKCTYFLTTDDLVQKKMKNDIEIKVLNPIAFIKIIEALW